MKIKLTIATLILLSGFCVFAQDTTTVKKPEIKHKNKNFVDLNKDGYNDNAPDHDGDGIPNGLDPDYQKLMKQKKRFGKYKDENGNGINDYLENPLYKKGKGGQMGKQNGLQPQSSNANNNAKARHGYKKKGSRK